MLLRDHLPTGELDIPGFLDDVGMSAVAWMPGNLLIVAMADGSLVRVPVHHPDQAAEVRLSTGLKTITAGIRVLPDGSIPAISSGLLSGGLAALLAGRPNDGFTLRRVDVRRPRHRSFKGGATSDDPAPPGGKAATCRASRPARAGTAPPSGARRPLRSPGGCGSAR
ncbi:hypothetical protein SAMN02787118_119122 [Streptomyces mirabilis]|uniref:Uncharacterized protein n=1 Tax=Streptomyces mirabilis TaxID=68239 RepID=A0A1I2RFL1_9ACTN|nr:hypothetical protein SAMN02787118_119122 [Streptomyces mirabilis]